MITPDTIDTIIQASRIEEVVGDFVQLRRRGVNMLGLCPFHNEKTPSFTVSPAKGIYKCFGCGKAGNSVNFIMEHEHFTYPEALRYLAKKYGIEIEEKVRTPEEELEQNEKESLYNLSEFARNFFVSTLHDTDEGKSIGMAYFRERGIRDDIVKKFQLGYSPGKWDAFSQHAIRNGYKKEYLIKTGLSLEKENRLTDRFHGRVMFPIHTASGRVIGFGGRILGSDKSFAKYVNSPESEIYNKSKTLYGIWLAKNAIISKDACLLVEGYTDVIALHQAGIENVVASSGTSLTQDQIRMIQRYTSNISILYDGDPAGIKASFRGIDMIVEQGLNVRIVLFPEGDDPDSYSRKHHPSEVASFIERSAVNFILFKTRLLLDETKGDPIKKASLIKEIVNTIALIPDPISRSVYVKECASVMAIAEQALLTELNKIMIGKLRKSDPAIDKALEAAPEEQPPAEMQITFDPDSSEYQEKEIIRLLLLYGGGVIMLKSKDPAEGEIPVRVADYVISDLLQDKMEFDNETFKSIYEVFLKKIDEDQVPEKEMFLHNPDKAIAETAINLYISPYQLSPNWHKNSILITTEESRLFDHVRMSLFSFKARKLDKMMTEVAKELQKAETDEDVFFLQKKYKDLKSLSVRINKDGLGRIITR